MDTSDPNISFDKNNICDHCQNYYRNILPYWNKGVNRINLIEPLLDKIKKNSNNQNFDCLLGISGGLDSSYLAYVAKKIFGLKPLLFHCDAGWNTEQSVKNIENIANGLNLDLHTDVIEWSEVKNLQRAFYKSGVPFQDVPQDLAFFSSLYNYSSKYNIKYILTGGNFSMESIRGPIQYAYFATDLTLVKDVFSKYGEGKLDSFPMRDLFNYKIYLKFIKRISMIKLLDYVPYKKFEAQQTLKKNYDWQPFRSKHYESILSKFHDAYWTPKRYNFDRRRMYLSSEILTEQLSRENALDSFKNDKISDDENKKDFEYIARKLDFSYDEFRKIENLPKKTFMDFKNKYKLISLFVKFSNYLNIEKRNFR
jgi:N-acetyl sugar amidotransferase